MEISKAKALFNSMKPPIKFEASYQRLYKAEDFLLESIGIADRTQRFNIEIDFLGTTEFIRTLLVEPKETPEPVPDLVLVHGFGGSWTSLYLILPYLTTEFRIWCIDLLGMAGSSRPEYAVKSPEEGLGFFIDSFEAWRKKVGLKNFYLSGHSLGGYVSGHYALKFPKHIIKLILISPGGVAQKDPIEIPDQSKGMRSKLMAWFRGVVWQKRWTPGEFFMRYSFLRDFSLGFYLKHRFKVHGEVHSTFVAYFREVLTLPISSEKCLFYMFGIPGYYGLMPLGEALVKNLPDFPIDFYFGDNDRMPPVGSAKVCENSKLKARLFIIANAGHQISMDNPRQLAQLIIFNKL